MFVFVLYARQGLVILVIFQLAQDCSDKFTEMATPVYTTMANSNNCTVVCRLIDVDHVILSVLYRTREYGNVAAFISEGDSRTSDRASDKGTTVTLYLSILTGTYCCSVT